MSELKRVPLTTLRDGTVDGIPSSISSRKSSFSATAAALLQGHHEAPSTSGATSASVPSDPMTSHQQASKTFRLELELFEPNSNSFPEFNYLKLVHLEKKKLKKLKSSSKVNGFADPFEENDDEVAKIAKELEKKYGSSYGSGRGKSKKDDYYDKGAGYDESDSFIDNTEAYDEIIPEEVETVEGGFYINSGALEFKHLSNYERSEDTIKLPKTAKKRTLSSSSSSEESEREPEAEAETEGNISPKQASTANKLKNGHMDKKQKGNDGSDRDTNSKPKNKDKKSEKIRPKEDSKDEEIPAETAKDKDKEKAVKTTTVKDMLKAKRDSFRKMQEGEVKMKMINGETVKSNQNGDSSESSGEDSDSEEEPSEKKFKKGGDEDPEKMRTSDTKLSEDLSEDLLKDVHELKDTAKSRNQCGKNFQFDDKITEIFLRIDDACSCLDKSTRNQVFAHIEYQLSLSKYYLLRKAKQLRIKQEKTKTKKAYMKLRKAVAEVMPSILLTYEANCRKVNDIRAKIPSDELSKMEQPPKYPKKKFPWTETLRNLLYELFQVRWTSYTVLRTRKETFEDFVNNYLKEKVAAIWPPGWMKYDDLKKELDKRKQSAKKPKENKKPGDIVPLSKNKLNDETSITIVEKSTEPAKSVLSTSNSMSVVSTKDLVVTITTKSIEKSTEVPNASAQNNTVSITQIPVDSGNSSKGRNSPVLTKSEAKAYKSSSGNSTNSSRNSPLPMQADQNHLNTKQIGQGTAAASVNSNYVKSSKSSSDKTSSNSNSCSNVNSHHKSVILTTNSISKGPIDLASPTKRATDHSINSIMSSPSPSPVQQHSSINLTATSPSAISAVGSTKGTDSNTTHVITVDHMKNATDIINTTNQLLNNNNNPNVPHNNAGNCNPSKECPIRIRSVANVNSSIEREQKKDKLAGNIRAISERTDHESSSESDGVEIVGVYPVPAKKSANITVNKNKYIKPSSGDLSGNNFAVNKANHKVKVSASDSRRNAEHILMAAGEVKEAELDVNQIMRALKELEEMQQSSIHISDGSPPASNSRSNVNSHAPISYGKDIKQ